MAAKNRLIAEAIAQAVLDVDKSLVLFGLSGSELIKAGQEKGLKVANEVFADRTYKSDGTLTPRSDESAMIHDSKIAVGQVIRMIKEGKVMSVDGKDVGIQADTICVHGDKPSALEFVKGLREALNAKNTPLRKSW
jgi:UPF0271 protein